MNDQLEVRAAQLELRSSGRTLSGYAALFDTVTDIGGEFSETIAKNAFKGSLANDILALVDHDPHRVLARSKSGALKLSEDDKGLHFEIAQVPQTSYANDIIELVRSGNAGGCSFGFVVDGPNGQTWSGKKRTLRNVILHEISIIASHAAYPQTTVAVRNRILGKPATLALVKRKVELLRIRGRR